MIFISKCLNVNSSFKVANLSSNNSTMKPPIVTYSVSISSKSILKKSQKSSKLVNPSTMKLPSLVSTIGSFATSVSSQISPTISSMISSRVIIPSVPPYSSKTTAMCLRVSWKYFKTSLISFVLGKKPMFSIID